MLSALTKIIIIIVLVIVGQMKHCEHATKPSFLSLDSPNNIRCGDMGIEEGTFKRALLATLVVLIIYAVGHHRHCTRHNARANSSYEAFLNIYARRRSTLQNEAT